MRIVWSSDARADLARIRDGIAQHSRTGAARVVMAIGRAVGILGRYARAGRIVQEHRDDDLREVVVGNYRIWYRAAEDRVRILCVWDARRGELPDRVEETVVEYALTAQAV